MDVKARRSSNPLKIQVHRGEESVAAMDDIKRGPWTVEEDFALMNYISRHGEGRWNSLARRAGLNRTGKSCRLRWLNYLRPDVRRGNITLEEQLLILELHSRWGNRWSKIAQYLPGRTDNEIKNYWRTRVQKHAKQLKCDVDSKQFKDAMRYLWMPRLVERIQAAKASSLPLNPTITGGSTAINIATSHPTDHSNRRNKFETPNYTVMSNFPQGNNNSTTENSCAAIQSDSLDQFKASIFDDIRMDDYQQSQVGNYPESSITSPSSNLLSYGSEFPEEEFWLDEFSDNLWNEENVWFTQQL